MATSSAGLRLANAVAELKHHHVNILLLTVSCCCLLFGDMQQQFIYHRQAIIEHGQLWRLLTAPLVHYSIYHAGFNLLSIVVLACLIGRNQPPSFLFLYLFSTLGTSAYLLVFRPDVIWFAGLSGYASALLFWFLCVSYDSILRRRIRAIILVIAILFYAKILIEYLGVAFALHPVYGANFEVLWESHLIGSLCAIALFLIQSRKNGLLCF